MTETAKISHEELRALSDVLNAKLLVTQDLERIEQAIELRHHQLLNRLDTSIPWSAENRKPTRALVVTGGFQEGKSTAIGSGLRRLKALDVPGGLLQPQPVSIVAPESFTVEALGRELLRPMLLVPAKTLGTNPTIERLHRRIRQKKPTFIHIDEAQRMLTPSRVAQHRRDGEIKTAFGHLRSLMDLHGWPVLLVLSGTPELAKALESAELGMFREVADFIHISPMKIGREADREDLADALNAATKKVGMTHAIPSEEFFDRLILAANYAKGLAFSICHQAILIAAMDGRKVVTADDFAAFYARKADCSRAANPFLAVDWFRIDPKALLAGMTGLGAKKTWEI